MCKAVLQLLSELPVSMEMERGLLTICGTADTDENDVRGNDMQLLLPYNFTVFNEIAWYTTKDWKESIA